MARTKPKQERRDEERKPSPPPVKKTKYKPLFRD